MKSFLLILLALSLFSISPPEPENEVYAFEFYEALWKENVVINENSLEDLEKIQTILDKKDLMNCVGEKTNPKQYFLKDLNFDGKDELIFNGACHPVSEFRIFSKNNNEEYESIYNHCGFLESMDISEANQKLVIECEPCCCIYLGSISIISKVGSKNVVSSSAIYHVNLLLPSPKFGLLREEVEITEDLVLRNYPDEKLTTIENPCTGKPYQENFLVEIKKGAEAEKMYEFGNWAFVLLKPNFEIIKNTFNQIGNSDNYVFGWVKNNKLKEEDF